MRTEKRRKRESLTRSLERIAGRIAANPSCRVEWNDRRLYSREVAEVTAKSFWVAGSYARGAPECGDLDLILDTAITGTHPSERTIAMGLYGSAPDTSLYIGTPERNSSNVAFPEARLVWSRESPDWSANLRAIVVDPDAGRFARSTDALPLRPDQLAANIEELEKLLELRAGRVLEWEFVEAHDVAPDPIAIERADMHEDRYGAKTREALRLAIRHHAALGRTGDWSQPEYSERTRFRCGGTLVLTGHPAIPVERLDNPGCDLLALVPHRSRRGPNGIWLITRGPEHPLEKRFAGCRAFYVTEGGTPSVILDSTYSEFEPAVTIELFRLEEDALDRAEMDREIIEDADSIEVASATGPVLLQLIAECDLVDVDGTSFAFTRTGQMAIRNATDGMAALSGAAELASALGGDGVE